MNPISDYQVVKNMQQEVENKYANPHFFAAQNLPAREGKLVRMLRGLFSKA